MPINNFPFLRAGSTDPTPRPWLFVQITNPDTGQSISTVGLVDTGADECSLPALYAELLGHNLTAGIPKAVNTGNGQTTAFGHTCTIDIFDTNLILAGTQKIVYTIPKTPIDFMPNLHCILLGVKTFLSSFILNIDYPKLAFSIRKP